MNKKEISEIKKTFSLERNTIDRICGCYVDSEKQIKFSSSENFQMLPEEDMHKYFDIFKKSLSGGLNKTLMNLEFPTETEFNGGTQEVLLKLRDSGLKDDDVLQDFYQKIIENYEYAGNYYIILIHSVYDIPGKAHDGTTMDDTSDEVYDHIMCCICPMDLTKPGLGYNEQKNHIEDRIRDWVVGMPTNAFLFPSFTDRTADIHSVLYYAKKSKELSQDIIENVLGTPLPIMADDQKILFDDIISSVMEEEITFENLKTLHESIVEKIKENKEVNEETVTIFSKNEVKDLLSDTNLSSEKLENFDRVYTNSCEILEETQNLEGFDAESIIDNKKFVIETVNATIKLKSDRTDVVQTKVIDGRKCILIEAEDLIKVNGLMAKF